MKMIRIVGGYVAVLAYLWASAYIMGQVLPDRWMYEWYGLPILLTFLAGLAVVGLLVMYIGTRCTGDLERK